MKGPSDAWLPKSPCRIFPPADLPLCGQRSNIRRAAGVARPAGCCPAGRLSTVLYTGPTALTGDLHVVEGDLVAQVQERRRALADEYLRERFASLPAEERAGVSLNIETGDPFALILERAREQSADLIVLGGARQAGAQGVLPWHHSRARGAS